MIDVITEKRDKTALYKELVEAGGKPAKGDMFHCPYHNDATASSAIRKSTNGTYYWKCFTCNLWMDVFDIRAQNRGISTKELFSEYKIPTTHYKQVYHSLEELVESLDAVGIEEVNPYTNPETRNLDLVTIRYLAREGNKKEYAQAYQSPEGFIKRRPKGLLPLFNRVGILESDSVIFVEGEKCVRLLVKQGYTATTGSGGASNAESQDLSILAGKTVYIWPDNDVPGKRYMDQIVQRLSELEPSVNVLRINIDELDLPEGGDVYDLYEKVLAEDGNKKDFSYYLDTILENAQEDNQLANFETLLEDMREGRYLNLPMSDFPILTTEAAMLLNKRIGIVYGGAGLGKSLFVGKICDDLVLEGRKAVRLQLEDEQEQHILRSFAQQLQRAELANPKYHLENPEASKVFYEQLRPTLDTLTKSIVAGEHESWDADKILQWVEQQLKSGKELVIVDPVSVIMTDKIWITSHRLMWGTKALLAKYPNSRVVYVSHNNTEGEVAGGQAFRRFCHTLLMLNRYKKPKQVKIADRFGEVKSILMDSSIGIAKTRYGSGNGLEIAVKLNPQTLCIEELGIVLEEEKVVKKSGRDLEEVEDVEL